MLQNFCEQVFTFSDKNLKHLRGIGNRTYADVQNNKSEFDSQKFQVILVSKLRLSHGYQWILLAGTMVKI